MDSNLLSFKCPGCNQSLVFDADGGKLKCPSCDNTYELEAIKEAAAKIEQKFDWGDYKENLQKETEEDLKKTVSYNCKYCGAEIITDAITAATKCPYCDNDIVIEEKLSGSLAPNKIIPFQFSKKDLKDRFKEFCKGKPFVPKDFITDTVIDNVQGIYVPFWLFSCTVDGKVTFDARTVHSWRSGDYRYTRTRYFLVTGDGKMSFDKVPVDGSIKMDDSIMDSLEPFNYSKLVDYAPGYLSGFVAERYDDTPDKVFPRADKRVTNSTIARFERDLRGGYSHFSRVAEDLGVEDTDCKYALLPVYVMKAKYKKKEYTYYINGESGKIVGSDLPVDAKKAWLTFGIIAGSISILLYILSFLLFH